jgi:uracil-DNA glycosylase
VYTTALVKYRRGDNAEPNETEMLSSLKYLSQEHRLLGRPPIVLFGRKVQEAFLHLNKYKLVIPARKEMKTGQWVWFQSGIGFPLLALHDPTFAVYQRGNLPSMVRDFQAVLNPPSAQPA